MSLDAQPDGAGSRNALRARIRNPRDVIAGILFIGIGIAAAVGASDYPLGTLRNIGPGYYPILLGIALMLLGGGIAFNGLRFSAAPSDEEGGFAVRPLVMVIAAVIAFGMLVRPFGLGAAIIALIVISSFAGKSFSIVRTVLLCAGMTVLAWLVFIQLLGLNMTMWPR